MTISARSRLRFPSVSRKASCVFHAREGVICTPMDCEYFRVAPPRDPMGKHAARVAEAEEEAAVQRAQEVLGRPKPTKRSPNAKKKRR